MAATAWAFSTASRVEFDVAPATMGTRPRAASNVIPNTNLHSLRESVGVSPVVPQGNKKSMPDSTWQVTRLRRDGSSMEPFGLKGVTRAVPQPRSFIALAYRKFCLCEFHSALTRVFLCAKVKKSNHKMHKGWTKEHKEKGE